MFGTLGDDYLLPVAYRPLYFTRVIAWAFSPFVPLLALASYLFPGTAPGIGLYSLLPTALLEILFVYMFFGVIAYRKHPLLWPVFDSHPAGCRVALGGSPLGCSQSSRDIRSNREGDC